MARLHEKTNAFLEPVLRDGLRPLRASVTFKKTLAASRSVGPVAFWELRKIFSRPSFEEIFDGYFKRDPSQVPEMFGAGGINLNPTLQIFGDASLVQPAV